MRPDLTNGKGTGTSPTLGINRGGSFVLRTRFLKCLRPSAEVKSLVKIFPCPHVSLSDSDDLSQSYLNFQHSDAEHLFMYFLAVCILFGELSIQVLCPFLN